MKIFPPSKTFEINLIFLSGDLLTEPINRIIEINIGM